MEFLKWFYLKKKKKLKFEADENWKIQIAVKNQNLLTIFVTFNSIPEIRLDTKIWTLWWIFPKLIPKSFENLSIYKELYG